MVIACRAGRSGIIGFGNIGRQIHKKLRGFDVKQFYAYDPLIPKESVPDDVTYVASINEILQNSDIITLHVPLLPSTHDLISNANLHLLRNNAIVLNASRGGIVHEADIAEAARDRGIIYIADTVTNEPDVSPLLRHENIIVTPHIASLTFESETNMLHAAIENYRNHKPMNQPKQRAHT